MYSISNNIKETHFQSSILRYARCLTAWKWACHFILDVSIIKVKVGEPEVNFVLVNNIILQNIIVVNTCILQNIQATNVKKYEWNAYLTFNIHKNPNLIFLWQLPAKFKMASKVYSEKNRENNNTNSQNSEKFSCSRFIILTLWVNYIFLVFLITFSFYLINHKRPVSAKNRIPESQTCRRAHEETL